MLNNHVGLGISWFKMILLFLTYLGILFITGIVLTMISLTTGFEAIEFISTGYISLILDFVIFFAVLLIFDKIKIFTIKALDFSVLRNKKTYIYLVAGFLFVSFAQYLIIEILHLEDPSAQPVELGVGQMNSLIEYFLFFLSIVILTPFKEEMIFRGIIHRFLAVRYHFWIGFIVSSLIFGAAHYSGGIIFTPAIMGMVFVLLYQFTKSLVPGILLHMIWNFLAFLTIMAL